MATDAEKGLALLKSVVSEHEQNDRDGEHGWRKCRACLALNELQIGRDGRRFVKAFLEEYEHEWRASLTSERGCGSPNMVFTLLAVLVVAGLVVLGLIVLARVGS